MVGSNGLEPSTSRLSGVRSNHLSYEPVFTANSMSRQIRLRICGVFRVAKYSSGRLFPIGQTCGGDEQNRTVDPLLARQVLSQLSYAPVLGLCLGESTLLSSLRALKIKQCKITRQTLTILVPFDLDV